MKRWNVLQLIVGICLIVFVLAACDTNGPASPSTSTPTNTSPTTPTAGTPASTPVTTPPQSGSTGTPASGQWQADGNALGQFGFTVSPDSTTITQVTFHISNLKCGSADVSIQAPVSGSWSVSNGQFTITATPPSGTTIVSLDLTITIAGTFDQTGKHASGTWQGNVSSQTCSGNWTGNSAG